LAQRHVDSDGYSGNPLAFWNLELVEAIGKEDNSVAQEVAQLQRLAVLARRSKQCVKKENELFRIGRALDSSANLEPT
jgi:hypothetical protein